MALVVERRGLESSKCFADTCLKQENDLRKIRLCISLSTVLQLEASTNSKVDFIAHYLVDKKRQNDPTLPFEFVFCYLI